MKIILDAMGGDNAPYEIIKGAVLALNRYDDFELICTGKRELIQEELKNIRILMKGSKSLTPKRLSKWPNLPWTPSSIKKNPPW